MVIKKHFNELTNKELWQIAMLRTNVFAVEQNFKVEELEENDYEAIHYFIKENDKIIAYSRVFNNSLGRVCTNKDYRGQGYQTRIIKEILKESSELHVSSQMHVVKFYESLGFKMKGDRHFEAGALHQDMYYNANK